MDEVLQTVISVHGHTIRLSAQQWAHITESHDYMAGNMTKLTLSHALIAPLLTLPAHPTWIDYDSQADVLYISFRKPQQANDSVMEEEDIIYHYRDSEVVGITVLNASSKAESSAP